jgi:thiamine monophosphate synthase
MFLKVGEVNSAGLPLKEVEVSRKTTYRPDWAFFGPVFPDGVKPGPLEDVLVLRIHLVLAPGAVLKV